jgi:hypothetical protein
MLQDKLAREPREEGGNGLSQIGRVKGQASGASRDDLAAGEGADPECGKRGRGGGKQWSVVTWRGASPSTAQLQG